MDPELGKLKNRRKHAPYQGQYKASNPDKYKGNVNDITYRSMWEFKMMRKLDLSESVEWWSSEEIVVWYHNPVTKKKARYFPDFLVRKKGSDGQLNTLMIEIKPRKQTVAPIKPVSQDRRVIRRYVKELLTYKVNMAKWASAREFCAKYHWHFVVMTEKELGIK